MSIIAHISTKTHVLTDHSQKHKCFCKKHRKYIHKQTHKDTHAQKSGFSLETIEIVREPYKFGNGIFKISNGVDFWVCFSHEQRFNIHVWLKRGITKFVGSWRTWNGPKSILISNFYLQRLVRSTRGRDPEERETWRRRQTTAMD